MLQLRNAILSKVSIKVPEKKLSYRLYEIYRVSGFARPYLPVTLNKDSAAIVSIRRKLLPYCVKTVPHAAKYVNTLNAESESIYEKTSYKSQIAIPHRIL